MLLGANLKIKSALLHDKQRLHKSKEMSHRDNRTHLLMTLWMLRPDTREGPLKTTSTLLHDDLHLLHSRSSQYRRSEVFSQIHV
jgi:hypothetical protein